MDTCTCVERVHVYQCREKLPNRVLSVQRVCTHIHTPYSCLAWQSCTSSECARARTHACVYVCACVCVSVCVGVEIIYVRASVPITGSRDAPRSGAELRVLFFCLTLEKFV